MSSDDRVDPTALEQISFALVRRGFDPAAVQTSLRSAATEIRRLQRLCDELQGRLVEQDVVVEDISEDRLEARRVAEVLGVEATQVLDAAHGAASERGERADREADAIRLEAIAAADALRAEGQRHRQEIMVEAQREADERVEEARIRGREMVGEAQGVRERMLRDLARKRQTGRAQVEQLRAGRDRLLDSLSTVQESLDTAIGDLVESVPDARAAAERAGMRIKAEPELTPEQLEAEIEAARLVGHPLVEDLPDPANDENFITGEMEALTHVDLALDPAGVPEPEPELALEVDPGPVVEEPEPDTKSDDGTDLFDVAVDEADDAGSSPEVDIFAKLREARDENSDISPEPEPEPEPEP
ncbi:MAG: hypothetical protein HOM37_16805, partial [Acidimicrobiaceae bacterium]|nr:hypothetical protein [Acidimicrobiaceae bacterium]